MGHPGFHPGFIRSGLKAAHLHTPQFLSCSHRLASSNAPRIWAIRTTDAITLQQQHTRKETRGKHKTGVQTTQHAPLVLLAKPLDTYVHKKETKNQAMKRFHFISIASTVAKLSP